MYLHMFGQVCSCGSIMPTCRAVGAKVQIEAWSQTSRPDCLFAQQSGPKKTQASLSTGEGGEGTAWGQDRPPGQKAQLYSC